MTKTATSYVDTTTVRGEIKAKPLPMLPFAVACGMNVKDVQKRFDAIKDMRAQANALQDALMSDLETAGEKRGLLTADMALAPWFKWGQSQVVRIYGARHGAPKAQATTQTSDTLAALLAEAKPVSKLIAKR